MREGKDSRRKKRGSPMCFFLVFFALGAEGRIHVKGRSSAGDQISSNLKHHLTLVKLFKLICVATERLYRLCGLSLTVEGAVVAS